MIVTLLLAQDMDWSLLSVISNSVFAGALVFVTFYYNYKLERRARMDRLLQEMDLLIAPLYANSRGPLKVVYFIKGSPGNINDSSYRVRQYFQFWDSVQRYKYLTPEYLRSAIDEYMKNKSDDILDRQRDAEYEAAENKLIERLERRYNELIDLTR
ncbi:hypothetical protein DSECCO2_465110 [anaerobic digester metagenome]